MRLNPEELEPALEAADLRVLLMVLFHYTGQQHWLEPPFSPSRNPLLIAPEDAGFTPEIQKVIRRAALDRLCDPTPPILPNPDEAVFLRMMRHCLAENVAEEYVPMMREQLGFQKLGSSIERPPLAPGETREPVIIIGAGVGGIILGKVLNDLGISYRILEKNADVGGTWFENTYPGAGVDTPNHAYSYSIGAHYSWSRFFSPQNEILEYLSQKADEFGVRPHIQFKTHVDHIEWDAEAEAWQIFAHHDGNPQNWKAPILVSAVGQISVPKIPPIAGIKTFDGALFHSSHWPDDLSVAGKKVAIIGSGASSMQIAPTIVDEVAELTIFQRSPQWARPIPRYHEALTRGADYLLRHVPFYAAWFRFTMFWRYGDGLLPFLRKDPDWPHPERAMNRINDRHRQEMTDYIEAKIGNRADLMSKSLPTYPPYGKRILLDNGWYDTLVKSHVTLHAEAVCEITQNEIIGEEGARCAPDIVVLATGFEVTKMASRLNISGPAGNLSDIWNEDDPQAYLGISVPDFPNFFMMAGPTTGLGHGGSGMFVAECQAHYIARLISKMCTQNIRQVVARADAQADYMQRYNEAHRDMIWMHPGMTTYYRNSKGRVYSVMPWRLVDYWNMTREPDLKDYLVRAA